MQLILISSPFVYPQTKAFKITFLQTKAVALLAAAEKLIQDCFVQNLFTEILRPINELRFCSCIELEDLRSDVYFTLITNVRTLD